jgi:hypothetical protein
LIPGYRDHALKGEWKGARSSYLTQKWRVLYVVDWDAVDQSSIQHGRIVRCSPGYQRWEARRGEYEVDQLVDSSALVRPAHSSANPEANGPARVGRIDQQLL